MKIIRLIIALGMLFLIYPLCYRPFKACFHLEKAKTFSYNKLNPAHYNKTTATAAIIELEKSLKYYFYKWEPHFLLGMANERIGNFIKAKEEYELCLKFNPGYARAHYNLGNTYYHLGNYDEAIRQYVECLKIEPTFEVAENNIRVMMMLKRKKP